MAIFKQHQSAQHMIELSLGANGFLIAIFPIRRMGCERLAESYVLVNGLGVGSPILTNVFLSV